MKLPMSADIEHSNAEHGVIRTVLCRQQKLEKSPPLS